MENKFSILVLLNSKNDLEKSFSFLIKDNCFSKLEIVLLDTIEDEDVEEQEVKNIFNKYDNFIYINAKGRSKSEAYNIGMKYATGDYISFIEQGITYDNGAIANIQKNIKKKDSKIVCLKPYYKQGDIIKPYKMCPKMEEIDLVFNPLKLNLVLESYFIHKSLLENKQFDENINFEDAKMKILLDVLIKYPFYHLLKYKKIYYAVPKEDDVAFNPMQNTKEWYNNSLTGFVISFLKDIYDKNGEIPIYVQEAMLYYIFAKYNCNINDRNKMVLAEDEAKEFFDNTSVALQYIDTELILKLDNASMFKIPRWLSYQFVLAKNKLTNMKTNIKIKNEDIADITNTNNKYLLNEGKNEHVNIYAINYNDNKLEIDFTISVQDFLEAKDVEAFVKYRENKIDAKKTNCYPLIKVFGLTVSKKIHFHVSIPVEENNKKEKIKFYFKHEGNEYELDVHLLKVQAHLNNSKYSYWKINNKYYLSNKQQYLLLEKKRTFLGLEKEIKYFCARMYRNKNRKFILKYFFLRLIYRLVKPFYENKQIWITFDKLYKAGDNGEYIYRYVKENHPETKIYYVIKKESLDYERLKKEKNSHILIYGTFKHKLMSLLSTVVLATHANAASYCGFDTAKARSCVCDLFNAEIICIQHGLTIQKIAQYQNRLVDNVKLYCCASKYEVQNLLDNYIYDYSKEQTKLVGLARYDGLKNNDKKQILITPTWRRYLTLPSLKYGESRKHNDSFKNSVYFKIYNNLINDEKLIEAAKKYGYKIVYLLHPCTSSQINDYDKNEYVELIAATDNMNYEKILTESSLMVTDYSGVQFDFAYMRKPIVYYHPDELPPHYESGGLDYETMGFGPICKTNEETVKELCEYMKNGCKTQKEYIKRANDFFEYDDYNNCKRTYDIIKKYMDERN